MGFHNICEIWKLWKSKTKSAISTSWVDKKKFLNFSYDLQVVNFINIHSACGYSVQPIQLIFLYLKLCSLSGFSQHLAKLMKLFHFSARFTYYHYWSTCTNMGNVLCLLHISRRILRPCLIATPTPVQFVVSSKYNGTCNLYVLLLWKYAEKSLRYSSNFDLCLLSFM